MKEKSKRMILVLVMIVSLFGLGWMGTHDYSVVNNQNGQNIPNFSEADKRGSEEKMGMPDDFGMMDKMSGERMPELNIAESNSRVEWNGKKLILLIGVSTVFSVSFLCLIMSRKNRNFYQVKDKAIIFGLSSALLITYISGGMILLSNSASTMPHEMREPETTERDKADLNESNILESRMIDLSEHTTDVTITQGGTYTFTGTFHHSILVNAENEEVEIILNGVTIETENTAAIIGLAASKITIATAENTENRLSDGGNSEYDGCIYSKAELVFEGTGKLIVNGNQNEGEGIATEAQNITIQSGTIVVTSKDDGINAGGEGATITINGGTIYIDASGDGIDSNKDAVINGGQLFVMGSDVGGDAGIDTNDGYAIHGGLVIALGSDMIEVPTATSQQKTLAFSLNEKIEQGTLITLMKEEEVIVSFIAEKSFRTLIISSDAIVDGDYSLVQGGSHTGALENGIYQSGEYIKGTPILVENSELFTVSENINLFGNRR